jgi:hypothetical protein
VARERNNGTSEPNAQKQSDTAGANANIKRKRQISFPIFIRSEFIWLEQATYLVPQTMKTTQSDQ